MQKKTKRIIIFTILLLMILAIILLILNTTKPIPETLTEQAKSEYTTKLGDQTYDITNAVLEPANITPTVSAGMIPIKWNGTNWVITTVEDKEWYNYSNGKPAYIMLNDGYYKSELHQGITEEQLMSNSVGNDALVVPNAPNNNPTIYMWIPRYAYNTQGEILYIKQGSSVAGTYTMPEIFTYETEEMDFSLAGIWVEYNPLANTSTVNTKINNMTGENNQYGFIANTIATNANNETSYKTTIETYIDALSTYTNETDANIVGTSIAHPQITDISSPNRTILKITNSSQPEPIKAYAYYDETEGKVKIEVIYSQNNIKSVVDEQNNIINNNEITVEGYGEFEYKFIVIDNNNNLEEIKIKVQTVVKAPSNMTAYRNNVGSIYTFLLTGDISTGTVWGSDIYTDDSNIAKAAVHAGILKNGETGIVKIEVMAGRSSYSASTRNGVTTSRYNSWPGSYRFVK